MLDPAAQPGLPPLFPRLRDIKFLRLCSSKSEKDVAQATTDLRQALGVAAESMLRADGSVSAPRLVIISTHQSCQLLGQLLELELELGSRENNHVFEVIFFDFLLAQSKSSSIMIRA